MNHQKVLIDLFCGAGGATKGYQRAGYYVIGVDINPQPNYCGDLFVQADAIEFLQRMVDGGTWEWIGPGIVAAYHASPPCQAHSDLQKQSKIIYKDFIAPTRKLLSRLAEQWDMPYVIENVDGAPLINPIVLCGTMFHGLRVIRHRLFESNVELETPAHGRHPLVFTYDKRKAHYGTLNQDVAFVQVTGGGNATVANKRAAMGIDWMTGAEVNEAIPPAYSEHIGRQLLKAA